MRIRTKLRRKFSIRRRDSIANNKLQWYRFHFSTSWPIAAFDSQNSIPLFRFLNAYFPQMLFLTFPERIRVLSIQFRIVNIFCQSFITLFLILSQIHFKSIRFYCLSYSQYLFRKDLKSFFATEIMIITCQNKKNATSLLFFTNKQLSLNPISCI